MKKYYNINELSIMTGLTTRTLRTYIKDNLLSGEKTDGIWKFTEEAVTNFISNPIVNPSIQAKHKAIISDFLIDKKKKQNQICSILDLCLEDSKAEETCKLFCNYINDNENNDIKFSFEKNEDNIRIIITGREESVMELLNIYYSNKQKWT